ncbi:Uncharacterized membrane protein [Clostridium cavendishii DSM 21758]|uniref:Uncharacterized membrane protein n=1 Tax=Clostridium cavendishii DSM 21758 TaxID=1121302 RepID=A0A1M6EUX9_9CLOT|nr:Uncharacterized membrane protein [Clostridium cavendishii DSM 21758]
MDTSRFKNYGLWVAIFALIPMVLQGFGVNILPDNYKEIVNAVLGILVMAGILNNPTTENKGFLDDEKKKLEDDKKIKLENKQDESVYEYHNDYDDITRKTIDRENSEGR